MKKLDFSPSAPPSVQDPLPSAGARQGIELLRALLRIPEKDRHQLDAAGLHALRSLSLSLQASLISSTAAERIDAVVRLLSHYPSRALSADAVEHLLEDWRDDLAGISHDVILGACRTWRHSDASFAPPPGHLIALCRPVMNQREFLFRKCAEILAAQSAGAGAGGGGAGDAEAGRPASGLVRDPRSGSAVRLMQIGRAS